MSQNTFISIITNIITGIFLLIILSYYFLVFTRKKKYPESEMEEIKSISIIMPAHNEEKYIKESLLHAAKASFDGKKEIIVIDDGSNDKTFTYAKEVSIELVKKFKTTIEIIKTNHIGKSASINAALKKATGDIIAIVDADSFIAEDSLVEITKVIRPKKVVAACAVVKVKNRKTFFGMWLHIEQIYNSLIRMILSKVNANITTPGPLSVYKRKALIEIGGFETKGFSEDVDIAVRLLKSGKVIEFAEKSITETNMPVDAKGFMRQRTRFARGWINIFKRHFRPGRHLVNIYSLPLAFFGYIQAVIMGAFTIYQLTSGYITYFISKGIYFSWDVARYFIDWLSIVGIVKWTVNIFSGNAELTIITAIGLMASLLSYPLFIFAIIKYDKKIDLLHIIPLGIMFPFWLLIMTIYILMLPEVFFSKQYNIWKKN